MQITADHWLLCSLQAVLLVRGDIEAVVVIEEEDEEYGKGGWEGDTRDDVYRLGDSDRMRRFFLPHL